MSSSIEINKTGYSENEVVENWAAVYAKKTIAEHRENAELDHPDGSVTYDKLDGGIKSRLNSAESNAETALKIAKASAAENLSMSSEALERSIEAEEMAQSAILDATAATISATEAVTISESAISAARSAASDAVSAKAQASEVADALPDKADVTYVDSELLKKQDKELEWQLITDTTLTEDASFKQTLPDNCVGLRVKIRVPKETALSAGQLYPKSGATWIYTLYIPGYNANTAQDKLITAEWTQKHGTWVYDCKVRTGAGNFNGSIIYSYPEIKLDSAYKYSLSSFPTLDELNYDSELKAGTIIKVWGLIK